MLYYTETILTPGAVKNWPSPEDEVYLRCLKKYLNFSVHIENIKGKLVIEKDGKKFHASECEIRCFEEILNDQSIKRLKNEDFLENNETN